MKGYGRFTQRLKVKKFSIKCVFKLGLDNWLCVLFSLWCLLFEDLEFQWWDSERRFVLWARRCQDPCSALCTLRVEREWGRARDHVRWPLAARTVPETTPATRGSCVQRGPRPFQGLEQAPQGVSTPAWPGGVCRGRSRPRGQPKPGAGL